MLVGVAEFLVQVVQLVIDLCVRNAIEDNLRVVFDLSHACSSSRRVRSAVSVAAPAAKRFREALEFRTGLCATRGPLSSRK